MVAKIYIDPRFHLHPKHAEIFVKIKEALRHYPEIKDVTLCSFYPGEIEGRDTKMKRSHSGDDTVAHSIQGDRSISFNRKIMPSNNVIYHELYHIVQFLQKKKMCDTDATIFGLARMPKKSTDSNTMSYIAAVPKTKVTQYAKIGANEAKKGNPNYLRDMKHRISLDYDKDTKGRPERENAWTSDDSDEPDRQLKFKTIKGMHVVAGHTQKDVTKFMLKHVGSLPDDDMFYPKDGKYSKYPTTMAVNPPAWMKDGKTTTRKLSATAKPVIKTAQKRTVKNIKKTKRV